MSISFPCMVCGHKLKAAPEQAGRRVKCTRCESVQVVPVPRAVPLPQARPIPRAIPLAGPAAPGMARPVSVPQASPRRGADSEQPPIRFHTRREAEEDELDMTPMIDVVFQLLIFFMVTASMGMQKTIQVPTPDESQSARHSRTIQELQEDDFVIVRIDHDDTLWVNDAQAPSEQELLARLRAARRGQPHSTRPGPNKLLVYASPDARHSTVVRALDAGTTVGMEEVRLATRDDE